MTDIAEDYTIGGIVNGIINFIGGILDALLDYTDDIGGLWVLALLLGLIGLAVGLMFALFYKLIGGFTRSFKF